MTLAICIHGQQRNIKKLNSSEKLVARLARLPVNPAASVILTHLGELCR